MECTIVCGGGVISCSLACILRHSPLVTKLWSDVASDQCRCQATLVLPDLALDPTSLALTLLEQAGEEVVVVERGLLKHVLPCFTLLEIPLSGEDNNNSVDLDPVSGNIEVKLLFTSLLCWYLFQFSIIPGTDPMFCVPQTLQNRETDEKTQKTKQKVFLSGQFNNH